MNFRPTLTRNPVPIQGHTYPPWTHVFFPFKPTSSSDFHLRSSGLHYFSRWLQSPPRTRRRCTHLSRRESVPHKRASTQRRHIIQDAACAAEHTKTSAETLAYAPTHAEPSQRRRPPFSCSAIDCKNMRPRQEAMKEANVRMISTARLVNVYFVFVEKITRSVAGPLYQSQQPDEQQNLSNVVSPRKTRTMADFRGKGRLVLHLPPRQKSARSPGIPALINFEADRLPGVSTTSVVSKIQRLTILHLSTSEPEPCPPRISPPGSASKDTVSNLHSTHP